LYATTVQHKMNVRLKIMILEKVKGPNSRVTPTG
jgi:hypothetical protein